MHCFLVECEDPISKRKPWKLIRRLLFITRCKGSESSLSLRDLFYNNLIEYSTSNGIEMLKTSFTFVTDCASAMPPAFGASVSTNRVPYSEPWIRCLAHQLNTAVKNAFDCVSDQTIKHDTENLKKLIQIVKNSGINETWKIT